MIERLVKVMASTVKFKRFNVKKLLILTERSFNK